MPISGTFQLLLVLYIILTGSMPTIVQATAFGLNGGGEDAFVVAMITQVIVDLLLIAPVILLSRHPLGILHPLLLVVVAWPLLTHLPFVVNDFGGWAGVFAGSPVETPFFYGLPGRSASIIWMAIAKFNGIRILGLVSTYLGFFLYTSRDNPSLPLVVVRNPISIRAVLIGLIAVTTILFVYFVRLRGGFNEHLTSLGFGRFRELSHYGLIIVSIQIGAVALWIWIAAIPSDIKSPFFLLSMAAVIIASFVSNGSRSSAIGVPLTAGLIWALRVQKIPWRIALILIPIMFVSIGLLGTIRTSSWYRSTAMQEFSNTGWSKSFAAAEEELTERRAESANEPIVERGFALTNGPLLGRSYAAALAAFIPRTVWNNKPRGVGSLYAQLFLGASFEGTTIPVATEIEIYWNFGLLGVVILCVIYGALLRSVYNFYRVRYFSPFVTVFYVVFITTFQFSSNQLVPLEQRILQIILCYGVVAMLVRKTGYPRNLLGTDAANGSNAALISRRPRKMHPDWEQH